MDDAEHAFAHEAGDFAGEVKTKSDGGQNGVPRRFPKRRWQHPPMNSEAHDQQRPDDKAGNADGQKSQQAAEIIAEFAATGGGVKAEGNADAFGEEKREQPQGE